MADKRLTELGVLSVPDVADVMHVVDVSDLTSGAQGTSKQSTVKDVVIAGGGTPANQIIINSVGDFAVQDGTTITLEEGKTYIRGAGISTGKRFVVGKNVTIFSPGSSEPNDVWEYTGTDNMFTGFDVEFFNAFNLAVQCPNAAQIFFFQDTSALNTSGVLLQFCIALSASPTSLAALKWGTFTNIFALIMKSCSIGPSTGIEDGITIDGTQLNVLLIDEVSFFTSNVSYVGLALKSTVITQTLKVNTFSNFAGSGSAFGILALTNSDNIATGIVGSFTDCEFLGAITPLSGISVSDLRYEFFNCPPLENSSKAADTFLTAQETVTINTAATFVAIDGTNWSSDVDERFSVSTSGLLTYLSMVPTKSQISITATVSKGGGGADLLQLAIAINGTEVTKTIVGTQNADPTSLTSAGLFTLSENDTIQAFVANDSGTTNIIVDMSNVIAINGF